MSYEEVQEAVAFKTSVRRAMLRAIGAETVTPTELAERINPYGMVIPGLSSIIWDLVGEGVVVWHPDRTLSISPSFQSLKRGTGRETTL